MTGDELDDFAVDRLLDGGPSGPPSLTRLLSAATAPGHAPELAGEESALSAYRLVRDAAPSAAALSSSALSHAGPSYAAPAREASSVAVVAVARHGRRRAWPRRVGLRRAAVGGALLAVAAAGGVAVAAGVVPASLRNLVPIAPASSPDRRETPGHKSGGPSGDATGTANTTGIATTGTSNTPSPIPTPANLKGLCHSFQEAAALDLVAALRAPRFAPLVTLAGRADLVPAYCVKVIDEKSDIPEPSTSAQPSP